MESKDHPIKIYSVCEALQMYAVPHYGEYGKRVIMIKCTILYFHRVASVSI